jgi:hypothetical protein
MEFLEECVAPSVDGFREIDFLLAENIKTFFCFDVPSISYGLRLAINKSLLDIIRRPFTVYKLLKNRKNLGIKALNNAQGIFGKPYYGGLPFKLGPSAMKWGIEPRQEQPLTASDIPGGTPGFDMTKHEKEAAETYVKTAREYLDGDQPAVFDFVVQVATDPSHAIEVGDGPWSEENSPYRPVGTFTIPPQSTEESTELNTHKDTLVFNPWNQLKAHRPLGHLNRARLAVYQKHHKTRHDNMAGDLSPSRCPMHASSPSESVRD